MNRCPLGTKLSCGLISSTLNLAEASAKDDNGIDNDNLWLCTTTDFIRGPFRVTIPWSLEPVSSGSPTWRMRRSRMPGGVWTFSPLSPAHGSAPWSLPHWVEWSCNAPQPLHTLPHSWWFRFLLCCHLASLSVASLLLSFLLLSLYTVLRPQKTQNPTVTASD